MLSINSRNHRPFIYITAVLATISVLIYLYTSIQIGKEVQLVINKAKSLFPGDQIESLMSVVESEDISLKERNKAVWALGQLGSEEALPVLQKHCKDTCAHESYLCQEELQKAIKLCKGKTNISALIWRKNLKEKEKEKEKLLQND